MVTEQSMLRYSLIVAALLTGIATAQAQMPDQCITVEKGIEMAVKSNARFGIRIKTHIEETSEYTALYVVSNNGHAKRFHFTDGCYNGNHGRVDAETTAKKYFNMSVAELFAPGA